MCGKRRLSVFRRSDEIRCDFMEGDSFSRQNGIAEYGRGEKYNCRGDSVTSAGTDPGRNDPLPSDGMSTV